LKTCIVDSGFFIAAFRKRDKNHESAQINLKKILSKYKIIISELIANEVLTFIRRKDGYYEAVRASKALFESRNITIYVPNRNNIEESNKIFCKYNGKLNEFSFTDASIVNMMQQENIKTIFSFDSDFDIFKELIRLEAFTESD
jgi:predicted nucleic acid-binding protein